MDLLSRAAEAGIEPSFTDVQGHVRVADPAVLKTLLAAMPARRPHRWFAEPVVIDPSCSELLLERAGGLSLAWELRGVDGFLCMAGETTTEILELPRQLAPGVYVLSVRDSTGREDQTPLIVTSRSAWQGKFGRVWIVAVQLYGLRSATNWGVGDFSDLTAMLKLAVRHGAAGVGLNPLHVLFDECPEDCSPYAPSSRLFLNMLYIDPTRAPGFPQDFIACHAAEIARLRQTPLVDYQAVAALKQEALRTSFMHFRNGGAADDHLAFEQFQAERGRTLRRFACFEVLRRRLGSPWWNWPSPWNSPCDDELEAFREGVDADEVVYREYLQWVADSQLGVCAKVASDLRMPIGLYLDVAVGVKPDGFDAWNEQIAISRDAAVGAPPDPMNTAGQNWGLAGFNATGLEQRSFAPFRDMLRASMRHAGAVRLDHVLGLQRIFLIPAGFGADAGVYVRMPFSALLALVALESRNARCVVIGEDLGTVPDGFRERLAAHGLLSYKVMLFERHWDGSFKAPWEYSEQALATLSTHDLPTFAAWREGHDLVVKRDIGIDPGESEGDRRQAVAALGAAVHGDSQRVPSFADIMRFLGAAPSRVLAVGLEDLVGERDQPNIPGTINQYPNWRRKLSVSLEELETAFERVDLRGLLGSRRMFPDDMEL